VRALAASSRGAPTRAHLPTRARTATHHAPRTPTRAGASAGAINATYFLSGQPEGLDIYADHLAASDRFLSLRRLLSRGAGPMMNLDYLLDEVMVDAVPLDWVRADELGCLVGVQEGVHACACACARCACARVRVRVHVPSHQPTLTPRRPPPPPPTHHHARAQAAVIDSPLPLKVVASSLTTLRSEILDSFQDRADLVECLKASANVPEIVGGPRAHRGHQLVDAAVFEPLPVKAALRDGCSHVLALCSRPYSTGPAWGRYVSRALSNAVKYWLLNPVRCAALHARNRAQPAAAPQAGGACCACRCCCLCPSAPHPAHLTLCARCCPVPHPRPPPKKTQQPYMREAWRVETLLHKGQHLDEVLLQLLLHGRALELDASFDGPSSSASATSSPTSSRSGSDSEEDAAAAAAEGEQLLMAAEGVLGGHVFPLFPGAAAGFAPVCTDVPTLNAGRAEGYRSVGKLVAALEALDRSAVLAAAGGGSGAAVGAGAGATAPPSLPVQPLQW
jgi:hypothetical protein